jgi:hypothetical protein
MVPKKAGRSAAKKEEKNRKKREKKTQKSWAKKLKCRKVNQLCTPVPKDNS